MIIGLACVCALPSWVFACFAFGAFFAFGSFFAFASFFAFSGAFALCRLKSIELLVFAPAIIIIANPSTTAGPAPGHMNIYELISMQQTSAALHDQLWK
jgi:hypothetical protein